jgi:hypothetical protein
MKRNIDQIQIRISDKYPIDRKFDFDEEIEISLKGEIIKKEVKNNQDGSVNLVLHFKALDYKITPSGL